MMRISELRLPLGVPVSGRHNSHTFTQNMRMDQGNTMLPEPALYKAANIHSRRPHNHSKDAYGSGEHDATQASPL